MQLCTSNASARLVTARSASVRGTDRARSISGLGRSGAAAPQPTSRVNTATHAEALARNRRVFWFGIPCPVTRAGRPPPAGGPGRRSTTQTRSWAVLTSVRAADASSGSGRSSQDQSEGETGVPYPGELPESRMEALPEVDPGWSPPPASEIAWQRNYRLALAHVKAGSSLPAGAGDLVVPGEDPGVWTRGPAGWMDRPDGPATDTPAGTHRHRRRRSPESPALPPRRPPERRVSPARD